MAFFGKKPSVPKLIKTDIEAEQKAAIAQNIGILPQASELASAVNLFNADQTKLLSQRLFPGLLDQAIANTSSQLRGELTPEIIRQNQRLSAASALSLGLGGSQFQSGLEGGRNLISALQLQEIGQRNFMQLQGLAPQQFGPQSMFFSPQERLAHTYQQNQDEWNRKWLSAQVRAAPGPGARFAMQLINTAIGAAVGGLTGGAMGAMGGKQAAAKSAQDIPITTDYRFA